MKPKIGDKAVRAELQGMKPKTKVMKAKMKGMKAKKALKGMKGFGALRRKKQRKHKKELKLRASVRRRVLFNRVPSDPFCSRTSSEVLVQTIEEIKAFILTKGVCSNEM